MADTKTTNKKKIKKHATKAVAKSTPIVDLGASIDTKESSLQTLKRTNMKLVIKLIVIALLGAGIFFLAQKYRSFFVSGMVGAQPITRLELIQRLEERYGQVAFDELVSERILWTEAKKNDISISKSELDAEVSANETLYGGRETMMEMAKTAGITTEAQLRKYFELKLVVQKLQDKLFNEQVTDAEVQSYYDSNKDLMYKDKKLEEVKEEVTQSLKLEKVGSKFSEWFAKVKQDTKIVNYLSN